MGGGHYLQGNTCQLSYLALLQSLYLELLMRQKGLKETNKVKANVIVEGVIEDQTENVSARRDLL